MINCMSANLCAAKVQFFFDIYKRIIAFYTKDVKNLPNSGIFCVFIC